MTDIRSSNTTNTSFDNQRADHQASQQASQQDSRSAGQQASQGTSGESTMDRAGSQARQAGAEARERLEETTTHVKDKALQTADAWRKRTAGDVRVFGRAVEAAADELESGGEPERVCNLARQASGGCRTAASYLEDHDMGQIQQDTSRIAREHPALFIGGLTLLGFAAGRVLSAKPPRAASSQPGGQPGSQYGGQPGSGQGMGHNGSGSQPASGWASTSNGTGSTGGISAAGQSEGMGQASPSVATPRAASMVGQGASPTAATAQTGAQTRKETNQ